MMVKLNNLLYVSMAYIVSIDIGMNNVPYNKSF